MSRSVFCANVIESGVVGGQGGLCRRKYEGGVLDWIWSFITSAWVECDERCV